METPLTGNRPVLVKALDRSLEKGEARVGYLRIAASQPQGNVREHKLTGPGVFP